MVEQLSIAVPEADLHVAVIEIWVGIAGGVSPGVKPVATNEIVASGFTSRKVLGLELLAGDLFWRVCADVVQFGGK